MDNLQNFRRTDYCGTFSAANVGQEISVCGWVQRQRNLGGLIFVDLRDRTGLLQLSFDDSTPVIFSRKPPLCAASMSSPPRVWSGSGSPRTPTCPPATLR